MEPIFGLELTKFFAHRLSNLRADGIEFLLYKLRRINPQGKQIFSFSLADLVASPGVRNRRQIHVDSNWFSL